MMNYATATKEDRQSLRAAMLDEMVKELVKNGPECTPEERRAAAVKIVNEAIARERAKETNG